MLYWPHNLYFEDKIQNKLLLDAYFKAMKELQLQIYVT